MERFNTLSNQTEGALFLGTFLFLTAAASVLLGIVVHSLKQQKHLDVHGLGKQIHSHGSHWTERGSMNSVGWSSAQAEPRKWQREYQR